MGDLCRRLLHPFVPIAMGIVLAVIEKVVGWDLAKIPGHAIFLSVILFTAWVFLFKQLWSQLRLLRVGTMIFFVVLTVLSLIGLMYFVVPEIQSI